MKQAAPTLFISYSWCNQKEADQIYSDLKQIGINVIKDNHDLKYKSDLKTFMQSIRDADFAIILISNDYLKSNNCMYESLQLLKERDVKDRILPVMLDDAKIYKPEDKVKYIQYWEKKRANLSKSLKKVDPSNAIHAYSDLKNIAEISGQIDNFIKLISDMNNVTFSILKKEKYLPILQELGFEDLTWAYDLVSILLLDSMVKKEIALDEYLDKYPPNSFYYAIKAGTYKRAGKFEQAKANYILSIKLDPNNYEAQNNLGQLYEIRFKDYDKAKECYIKAISAKPELSIARLNLGVLLSNIFKDNEGAKEQYEEILKFDPNEERAHNNLGTYYRFKSDGVEYSQKIIYHLEKAIEINPKYIEAYINYGNYYKTKGDLAKGNEIYKRAKIADKEGRYTKVLDLLLKSTKG
ncbi:MAG TPA: tetratricopeptide repeat protein [Paludibacter sp.]